jgi:hypothetical protein
MITIELNPEYHIWEVTTKYETRPVLQGIYVNPKGYMVAADGYMMACVPCKIVGLEDPIIIPKSIFKTSKRKHTLWIDIEKQTVETVLDNGSYIKDTLISGTYPDFQSMLPKYIEFQSAPHITLNPALYSKLGNAIGLNKQGILLMLTKTSGPCFAKGLDGAWGMIMPIFRVAIEEKEFNEMVGIL